MRLSTNVSTPSVDCNHWRTVMLSVQINVQSTGFVNANWISSLSWPAHRASCISSAGLFKGFIGETQAFPITNASSVLLKLTLVVFPWRKTTGEKTTSELLADMLSSIFSICQSKWILRILFSVNFVNSSLHWKNLSTLWSGNTSSHFWMLSRPMPFKSSRVWTV